MNIGYNGVLALRGGNTLFAIKAAVLTGESTLPLSVMTARLGLTCLI